MLRALLLALLLALAGPASAQTEIDWSAWDRLASGVEQAIDAGVGGDFAPFHRLIEALSAPFDDRPEWADLALPPAEEERVRVTYCGT